MQGRYGGMLVCYVCVRVLDVYAFFIYTPDVLRRMVSSSLEIFFLSLG